MKQNKLAQTGQAESTRFSLTLPGILLIVAGYALIHASTRLLASGNLGEDDTFDSLLIQTLAPGYGTTNGPLYDWALWLMQQVFGTGLPAFLLLKYSLLVTMAGGIFALTRRLTGSALWAFIAVESMATVYQIFWRFHEGFTHRVGAMALVITTLWAFFRLVDNNGWRNYLLFAGLVGLGLLSEHSYVFFLLALLAASGLQPGLRRLLYSRRTLATLPLAILIALPYLYWLQADPQRTNALIANFLPLSPATSLAACWNSLRDGLTFPILVLAPYVLIVPLTLPGIFKSILRQTPLRPAPARPQDLGQLLTHLLLLEFAGVIVSNLLYSRSGYAVHSILPLFIIGIVWLTDKARQTEPSPRQIKRLMLILFAFTLTAYAVRWANLFIEEPFCSRCRWGIPYADLAENLRQQGFANGTLITGDERMSGNLRRFFPEAHFLLPNQPGIVAQGSDPAHGKIAFVWAVASDDLAMPGDIRQLASPQAAETPSVLIRSPWHHLWRPTGYRNSTWASVVVDTVQEKPAAH